MTRYIIFPNDNSLSLISPVADMDVMEVARKDVPAGSPYLIVDAADLPDLALLAAWEADFSEPDGYGIGADAWFAEQAARQAEEEAERLAVMVQSAAKPEDRATGEGEAA